MSANAESSVEQQDHSGKVQPHSAKGPGVAAITDRDDVGPVGASSHPKYCKLVFQEVPDHSLAVNISAGQAERTSRDAVHHGGLKWVTGDPQVFAQQHVAIIGSFLDPLDVADGLRRANTVPLVHSLQCPASIAQRSGYDDRAKTSVRKEL